MEANRVLKFTNPATGEEFGEVAMTTPEQVRELVGEMRQAQHVWREKPLEERIRIMRRFQEVMIDSHAEITAVMNQDCGKSRQDALIEVYITAEMLQNYLKLAPRWLRRQRVSTGLLIFKKGYIDPRPYGVVAVIAPWNYPFALSMPAVLGALLAGNTVVLKPSEVTAATGVMIEKLFRRVPELAPYVRVVHGDGAVGAALVEASPDYIFLTSSTQTGKKVIATAAEKLIPVACELGGKDAMIVLEDADIPSAAHWGAWGAHFNTGQTCMAVERVYVVEPVYEAFIQRVVAETRRLKVGYTPDQESPFYLGPMTDPRQVKIVQRHLDDALEKGARILTGGGRNGMYFEPTVLVDVDHSMQVMHEETFGPLLPVMKVRDEAEAIRLANDCSYGLGASVWSKDLERAQRVAHQIEAASIVINDTIAQFAVSLLPFGGIKQSGYGRTHGKEGLMQFTRPYSYLYGAPPLAVDLATQARRPGNYRTLETIMHLAFGATPRQRLKPVNEILGKGVPQAPRRRQPVLALGIGAAAIGAMAGFVWTKKGKR